MSFCLGFGFGNSSIDIESSDGGTKEDLELSDDSRIGKSCGRGISGIASSVISLKSSDKFWRLSFGIAVIESSEWYDNVSGTKEDLELSDGSRSGKSYGRGMCGIASSVISLKSSDKFRRLSFGIAVMESSEWSDNVSSEI